MTGRTTNGRVTKGEFLSQLPCLFIHLGCGNLRANACHVFESRNEHDRYAVVLVKVGVVVGLLPKGVSRIAHCFYVEVAELHVHMLNNDIMLELIPSLKKFI